MEQITVYRREGAVKAKQLRRQGVIPCVIYGGALDSSIHAQMDKETVKQMLRGKREGSAVELVCGDRTVHALIKTIERSVVGGEVIHISFQAMQADRRVNGRAQIVLLGRDKVPGILEQSRFDINYSSLPADIFDTVTIDLEGLPVGASLTVGDIPQLRSERIELLTPADSVVFKIADKTRRN